MAPAKNCPTGRVMVFTTLTIGDRTVEPIERSPEVNDDPDPDELSATRVRALSTRIAKTVRERRERRVATWLDPCDSASRGGDQYALEGVELLEALARPDGHAVQRVSSDHDRHTCLLLNLGVEAVEQRTTTG